MHVPVTRLRARDASGVGPAAAPGPGGAADSSVGVRAKVARALELLLQLDEQLHAYLDTDPLAAVQELRNGGRDIAVSLRVTRQPPVELSLLVGEVAHQLRSALDHLAYGFVLAAGNTPTTRTSFPVATERPAKQLSVAGGIRPKALAAVEALQPYQRPDPEQHPLHTLNTLWNIDKHRHLHLTTLQVTNTSAFLQNRDGTAMVGGQLHTDALREGDLLGYFAFAGPPADPDMDLITSGLSFVALGDPGPWPADLPVQLLLEQLHQYVALTALPRLEPHLEAHNRDAGDGPGDEP